jgi:hypothetical protein
MPGKHLNAFRLVARSQEEVRECTLLLVMPHILPSAWL